MSEENIPQENNEPENANANHSEQEIINLAIRNVNNNKTNMEVHKHPHHVTHKKRWVEYLLEFFMLFLAVTLGFFAENMREGISETSKAKEYAQSLYDDFKIDTAYIQRTIYEKKWIISKYDSAKIIIAFNKVIENNKFIYNIERYLADNDVFTSQDVTYQQLRSSGNFRYFKSIPLYKKIANYFNLYSRYQQVDCSFSNGGNGLSSEMESKIFDPEDLSGLTNEAASNFTILNYGLQIN